MSLRRFLVLDFVGTAMWIALIVGLGYAIGHPAVRVATLISRYSLYVAAGLVVAAILYSVLAQRRR